MEQPYTFNRVDEEYGWFSDIESNPEIILVEYSHVMSKNIYRVRNVRIEYPCPTINISLTGEQYTHDNIIDSSGLYPNNVRNSKVEFGVVNCALNPRASDLQQSTDSRPILFVGSGFSEVASYNISKTHNINIPHVIRPIRSDTPLHKTAHSPYKQHRFNLDDDTESYVNLHNENNDNEPHTRDNSREWMNLYKIWVRNICYIITIYVVCALCCCMA